MSEEKFIKLFLLIISLILFGFYYLIYPKYLFYSESITKKMELTRLIENVNNDKMNGLYDDLVVREKERESLTIKKILAPLNQSGLNLHHMSVESRSKDGLMIKLVSSGSWLAWENFYKHVYRDLSFVLRDMEMKIQKNNLIIAMKIKKLYISRPNRIKHLNHIIFPFCTVTSFSENEEKINLHSFDFHELKMIGVIQDFQRASAILLLPTQQTIVVNAGTFIGQHGIVQTISSDSLIIKLTNGSLYEIKMDCSR